MLLPKKINHEYLRQAIVEVRYSAHLPFEVLIGIFFNALDDTYNYINRPFLTQRRQVLNKIPIFQATDAVQSLFYTKKITLELRPNTFVFSCLDSYLGWDEFYPEIEKTLKTLFGTKQLESITRVGMRYINEIPERDLRECIKFSFSFGLPSIQSSTTAFRSQFDYKGCKIILNLNNKVPAVTNVLKTGEAKVSNISIIDLDVIAESEVRTCDAMLKVIQNNHDIEKELYFGMLLDEFLMTLNPQY